MKIIFEKGDLAFRPLVLEKPGKEESKGVMRGTISYIMGVVGDSPDLWHHVIQFPTLKVECSAKYLGYVKMEDLIDDTGDEKMKMMLCEPIIPPTYIVGYYSECLKKLGFEEDAGLIETDDFPVQDIPGLKFQKIDGELKMYYLGDGDAECSNSEG